MDRDYFLLPQPLPQPRHILPCLQDPLPKGRRTDCQRGAAKTADEEAGHLNYNFDLFPVFSLGYDT